MPAAAKEYIFPVSVAAAAETFHHDMTAGHDEAPCPLCETESPDCAQCQEGICASPACASHMAVASQSSFPVTAEAGDGFDAGPALSGLYRHTLPLPPP